MPKNKRQSPTKHSQRKGNRSSGKDQIFQSVQEMFSGQIEAEVIHLVLEECDWQGRSATFNHKCRPGNNRENYRLNPHCTTF